jgi:hypothetical protein
MINNKEGEGIHPRPPHPRLSLRPRSRNASPTASTTPSPSPTPTMSSPSPTPTNDAPSSSAASTPTSTGPAPTSDGVDAPSSSCAQIGYTDYVVVDEDDNVPVGSKRKLKSDVWLEFDHVIVAGKQKAKCHWCKNVLLQLVNLVQIICVVI